MRRRARVQLREWAILTLLLAALLVAAVKWDWLARADFWLFDTSVALSGRAPDPAILILAIDEESLAHLGRWPWSRQVLADALERLTAAGAGPVLLDIILSEPQRDDPLADARLATAIAAHGRVVLSVFMPPPGDVAVLPLPAFAAGGHVGHTQALVDRDGVTRRYLAAETAGTASFPHVAQVLKDLSARAGPLEKTSAVTAAGAIAAPTSAPAPAPPLVQAPVLIPFAGPPGHFSRRSVAALLEGRIPAQEIKGRLILFGATAAGLGDNLATPLAGSSGTMPGVELVANVLDGLRSGASLQPVDGWQRLALSAALLLALMVALLVNTPQAALWITGLGCTGVALAAFGALKLWGGWWPPAAPIAVMSLAYPLWSWRRLEASLRAMTRETRRIAALTRPQADPQTQAQLQLGQQGQPVRQPPRMLNFFDPVETRIADITRAVDQIASTLATDGSTAELRQHREDMMRHLAHDLRSPLVSLRSLADTLRGETLRGDSPAEHDAMLNRIDACARRALDLSEQFLLMGRAESIDPATFGEVDLVQILHQSADDLWEDARSQGVRIERRCALDCVLVRGDARLLHRVLLNLGWNAIRHGPPGGTVTLSLDATPTRCVLAVHDQGAGFAPEALAHLSQRYTQAAATATLQADAANGALAVAAKGPVGSQVGGTGHGLGLALVKMVADKHQATLAAHRPPEGGFSVTLWLARQ